jgi:hypothetical protein
MRLFRSAFSIRLVAPAVQAFAWRADKTQVSDGENSFHQKMGLQFAQRKLQSGGKSTCSSTKVKMPGVCSFKPMQPFGPAAHPLVPVIGEEHRRCNHPLKASRL